MKDKIKTQKGFIQIPLLMAVIISIIAVSTAITGIVLQKQGKLTPLIANISQIFQKDKEVKPEIESEEPKTEQKESLLGEISQENSQTEIEQKLEQTKLEVEKAKQEAEKAKLEVGRLKAEQEAQKLSEERQRQEELQKQQEVQKVAKEQKQKELEKKQAGEKEKITNIELVDEKLSQLISIIRERIDKFTWSKNDTDSYIPTVRNKMNEYLDSLLVQQSGQQLINELDNFSFIAKKLIDIDNSRMITVLSFLGSDNTPSSGDFPFSESEYKNYFDQYNISDAKIDSLIRAFVNNEATVLDKKIEEGQEKLSRATKATQASKQLIAITREINNQIAILDVQIQEKRDKIEQMRNEPSNRIIYRGNDSTINISIKSLNQSMECS